jgi:hypothetical protein
VNYLNVAAVTTLTIRDSTGALADPDTLTAYLRDPAGSETIYVQGVSGTWTHPSTGSYTFSFTPNRVGNWRIGFTAEHTNFVVAGDAAVNVTTLRPFD